jgi:hypothetical protein
MLKKSTLGKSKSRPVPVGRIIWGDGGMKKGNSRLQAVISLERYGAPYEASFWVALSSKYIAKTHLIMKLLSFCSTDLTK